MSEPPIDLVGTVEAAQILHRDDATVLRWAASGKLPIAHRMPGRTGAVLFRRGDVLTLAAAVPTEASA